MATQPEIIDHAIEQACGQRVPFEVEQIVGPGEVNDVFRVRLANDTVVVRLHEASELWRFEMETWCIDRVARHGVPGPAVLALGEHRGHAFHVLSFLDGPPACTRPEWRLRAWQEIGRRARTIHRISVAGFGETLDDIVHASSAAWPEYVHANIRDLADGSRFVDADILGPGDADLAALWIEQLAAGHLDFGLTHGDLSLENAIWRDETTLVFTIGAAPRPTWCRITTSP